jgi:trans-4-hydroxy-L-proline dehydratase
VGVPRRRRQVPGRLSAQAGSPPVDHRLLAAAGEHFAAGYFELPGEPPAVRWSRAARRRFESRELESYDGGLLYPCGRIPRGGQNRLLAPSFSSTWQLDAAEGARMAACDPSMSASLRSAARELGELEAATRRIRTVHTVGGRGYTHSIPDYGSVLRLGLEAVRSDIERRAAMPGVDEAAAALYRGLLDLLQGIRVWHTRALDSLARSRGLDEAASENRDRLVDALRRVPFLPARTFHEAAVAYNFVYYLDDCDNPGRVDLELLPYYQADLTSGATRYGAAVSLMRALWRNVDSNDGWNAAVGGSDEKGGPCYNPLTRACVEAARGSRRPNLQLHVRPDMPDALWEEALLTIASGCGIPALYNDPAFREGLDRAGLGVSPADHPYRNGGGCTETMIHGRSNVGSLDAGINLPLILTETLEETLASAPDFDSLLHSFEAAVARTVEQVTSEVSEEQEARSRLRPHPVRSLLVRDCIERGRDFTAGGARYNWSVVNVCGLADVADSLFALKEVVYRRREKTPLQMLELLRTDFAGGEAFRRRLGALHRYGNGHAEVDGLATRIAEVTFRELGRHRPWRGGRFLPACLMFVTYAEAGKPVGATPDGRKAGEPLADSAGPHQGRDTQGPTAMLASVARLPQILAPGTLVVNIRLDRGCFGTREQRAKVRGLVEGYFRLGGMQLQVTCVDQAALRDALEHPERHAGLIVRIGGYSEYWSRLSPDLRRTVLERTEHRA